MFPDLLEVHGYLEVGFILKDLQHHLEIPMNLQVGIFRVKGLGLRV